MLFADDLSNAAEKIRSRPEVFCKKDALEISQNLQESHCPRVSF